MDSLKVSRNTKEYQPATSRWVRRGTMEQAAIAWPRAGHLIPVNTLSVPKSQLIVTFSRLIRPCSSAVIGTINQPEVKRFNACQSQQLFLERDPYVCKQTTDNSKHLMTKELLITDCYKQQKRYLEPEYSAQDLLRCKNYSGVITPSWKKLEWLT
jgi:hypothetical protein